MRVFFCLFIFLTFSCSNTDSDSSDNSASCVPVIFDEANFNSTGNFGLGLNEFSVDGFCLTVTLGVGGCDDDHTIDMISDGSIAESFPPQITFDFYDHNPQPCNAFFMVEREYDLSPIKELYDMEIIIRFRNSENFFNYSQ